METLKILRKQKNKTQAQIANEIGLTQQAYATYESDTRTPPADILSKLADYFHVSVDHILGREEIKKEPGDYDRLLEKIGAEPIDAFSRVPVLGSIVAGIPIEAQLDVEEFVFTNLKPAKDFFALRVRGESMKDVGITNGSIVIARKQEGADDNDIVIALVNGSETTVKRFKKFGAQYCLCPENRDFETIVLTPEMDCKILGIVMEVHKRFK